MVIYQKESVFMLSRESPFLILQQRQQQQHILEENMSNLTSQSGTEASVSSGNIRAETNYQQYFATPPPPAQAQPPAKKKRNLPGNPG